MVINYIGKKVNYNNREFISGITYTKKGVCYVSVTKKSGLELHNGINAFEVNKQDIFIGNKDAETPTIVITKGSACEPEQKFIAELVERREQELAEYFD